MEVGRLGIRGLRVPSYTFWPMFMTDRYPISSSTPAAESFSVERRLHRGNMIPVKYFCEKTDKEEGMSGRGQSVDPGIVHDKIWVFAQQLLNEAKGDPVRALGLLVLTLDGPEVLPVDHAWRLMVEVRRILMPEATGESPVPIRHLVATASWEGDQHCLRCGRVLGKKLHGTATSLLPGYVFEIGSRLTSEPCENYRACG